MVGKQKPQTHEQKEKAFASIFQTVRADGSGTGMGTNDDERDKALKNLSFEQIPGKATEYTIPEAPQQPPKEHPNLMDDLSRKSASQAPLVMDEKTKKFYALFEQVTPGQQAQYGGQAVQPDAPVDFATLPSEVPSAEMEIPETKPEAVKHRDFLGEDAQTMAHDAKETKSSDRYQKAHDAYVQIFGNSDKE